MKRIFYMLYVGGAIVSVAAFCAGPLLAYFEVLEPIQGFGLFALGNLLGLLVGVCGVGAVLRRGLRRHLVMPLLGALPGAFLVYSIVTGLDHPPINDISTELNYPPTFENAGRLPENAGRDMSFPKEFREAIRTHYPTVNTLAMTQDMDTVFERAMAKARDSEGWEITSVVISPNQSSFEGIVESKLFRFRDDIVVRVTSVGGGGCVVDMRSKSRAGKGDLGANAQRIKDFFTTLQAKSKLTPPTNKV